MTIAASYPLAVILSVVFYAILSHGPLKKYQIDESTPHTQYALVDTVDENNKIPKQFSIHRPLNFLFKVFPFTSYYYWNYFAYYLAANAVLTTLTFPSAPFRPRDHYPYYRLSGDIGTILGGLELMLVSCLCSIG